VGPEAVLRRVLQAAAAGSSGASIGVEGQSDAPAVSGSSNSSLAIAAAVGTPRSSAASSVSFNGSSLQVPPGSAVDAASAGGAFGLQPVVSDDSVSSASTAEFAFVAARWPIELHRDEISANASTLLGQNATAAGNTTGAARSNDTVFTSPPGASPKTTLTVSVDGIDHESGQVVQPGALGLSSRVFLPIDVDVLAEELSLAIVDEQLQEVPVVGSRPNVTISRNTSQVLPLYTVIRCEFWNEEASDGRGSWDTKGCEPEYVDLDIGAIACLCGHHTDIKGRMQ